MIDTHLDVLEPEGEESRLISRRQLGLTILSVEKRNRPADLEQRASEEGKGGGSKGDSQRVDGWPVEEGLEGVQ